MTQSSEEEKKFNWKLIGLVISCSTGIFISGVMSGYFIFRHEYLALAEQRNQVVNEIKQKVDQLPQQINRDINQDVKK
jgi:hypothetical protein